MARLSRRHFQQIQRQLRHWQPELALNPSWRAICEAFELQERILGRKICWRSGDQDLLAQEARLVCGVDLRITELPDQDRQHAAGLGFIDEKLASVRPNDQYLLLTSQTGDLGNVGLPPILPGTSLRVHLSQLDVSRLAQVIVVENQDCFDNWPRAQLPARLDQSIAIYRGNDALAKGCRAFLLGLPHQVAVSVFADLDPKGMEIALTTPRVTHLLAPVWCDELARCGSETDFSKQIAAQKFLQHSDLGGWWPLWQQLKQAGRSIKQQHVLADDRPLELVPLAGD